ncbi:uncharacterized protein LOC134178444 [Corticium candelabrum]|uniref:uncharacterized protein LOC134178444 n=1 Tax=Corticium candelabrum TaxID=121492 RepID=UPI002E26355C|nr:uncharacterized protein LOC134178444 [Corticium candelabrum]
MSAQNRATANGGNTRKSKKKRNARSQPKCDDEQKRTSGGEETTGGCAQRDGAQRDEVKIEKVRQPINKSLTSGSGAVTRALDSALTTRLDSVPSFDGENCLLCYKPRDVTSHIGGTNEDQGPLSLWLCPECRLTIEIRQQKKEPVESTRERFTTPSGVTENRDVVMPDVLTLSNGLHREIETLVPRDKDTTVMQSKWMELRHAIRCAYRQAGTSLADWVRPY